MIFCRYLQSISNCSMIFNDGFRLILDIFMTPISLNFICFSGIKSFSYKRFKRFEDYQTVCVLLVIQFKVFLLQGEKFLRCNKPSNKIHKVPYVSFVSLHWFVSFFKFFIALSITRLKLRRKRLKITLNHGLISFMISEHVFKLICCIILMITIK